MGGFQLGVSRYSAHLPEATELVKDLTASKVQKARAAIFSVENRPGGQLGFYSIAAFRAAKCLRDRANFSVEIRMTLFNRLRQSARVGQPGINSKRHVQNSHILCVPSVRHAAHCD